MTESLAVDYLRWLEPQIRNEQGSPEQTYWQLLGIMFEKPFVWHVSNDDNRIVDGLDLRVEFAHAHHIRVDALQRVGPCSFLEVLIGLSRRLSFAAGGTAQGWGWQLLDNLNLQKMVDPLRRPQMKKIHDILDTAIGRTYQSDGSGGFFPLSWPDDDQTKLELWYQMSAYINEIHPEY